MKIRPSMKTEVAKIILYSLFFVILYIMYVNNIANLQNSFISTDNIIKNSIYENMNTINLIGIVLFIYFIIIIMISLLNKIMNLYTIEEEGFLKMKRGIILKEEDNISIKEIRRIITDRPNIYQFLTGVRTIKIEADGVEGWDSVLSNVSSYNEIERKILEIKNARRN